MAKRKIKGPSRIKPQPKSRRVQELAADDYVDPASRTSINQGREFQARDGSNLRTMAEAEQEELQEAARPQTPERKADQARPLWLQALQLAASPIVFVAELVRSPARFREQP